MKTKITFIPLLFFGLSASILYFALVPTTAFGAIMVCGDCCDEPYEESRVYGVWGGGAPETSWCEYNGSSWSYCEECVTRNSWGLCTEYDRKQGYYMESRSCGGCAGVTCRMPPTTRYSLTTRVNPVGSGTVSPSSTTYYDTGSTASISKSPASGYVFSNWSGDCTGTVDICRIQMNSNKTVTANFALAPTPSTISCSTVSSSQINLSWTATSTATSYSVVRCEGSGCGPRAIIQSGLTSRSWSNASLTAGTTYGYRVLAYTPSGSVSSNTVYCTTSSAVSPTLTATLTRTPTTGDMNTLFNFTVNVSGTATGTITYATPSCGTGGTLSNWSGSSDNTFTCRYPSSPGSKIASATVARQGLSRTATNSFTVDGPTVIGTLTASPTSGLVGDTFTFTATRTGGTATGTVTYTNPVCTNGTLVTGSYSGTSDRTFQCRYSTASSGWFDYRGARMTINQGTASTIVSSNVTVNNPGFYVSLAATPTTGTVNTTTFNFTPTAHNIPPASAWGSYSVSYSSPTCGSGASPTNFSNSAGTFRCLYSTTGIKGASVVGTATRTFSPTLSGVGSRSVTVGAAPNLNVQVNGPSSGIVNQVLNYTTAVTGTATGSIIYDPPTCGTGGARTSWNGAELFSCRYSSPGDSTVRSSVTRGGLSAFGTRSVNISEPVITGITVTVYPTWIPRGESTTVTWTTDPPDPGSSATCSVTSDPSVTIVPLGLHSYSSGPRSVDASNIQQSTRFDVTCTNPSTPDGVTGSATVYVLPSYSEF